MHLVAADSVLLLIDLQGKLMPAIADGDAVAAAAGRLAQAAGLLEVPVRATEHNPGKLGPTLPLLRPPERGVWPKMHFDACREPGFGTWLPAARKTIVVAGCEAHVCVLQTVQGLLRLGYQVALVADAAGSRRPADHHAALCRAQSQGAQIVTSEMAIFEWLETCEHPRFREVLQLVK